MKAIEKIYVGVMLGMMVNASIARADDFPRPCMVFIDHLYTPDRLRTEYETYDPTDKSDCSVSYGMVNGEMAETRAGIRPMMLSIAANGSLVRVRLDNNCYATEADAKEVINKYRLAGVCK